MTHDREAMPQDAEITIDIISEFVNERFANSACPICSTNDWTALYTKDLEIGIPAFSKSLKVDGYFPTFGLYCNNCGFISHHMRVVVERWLENREEPTLNFDGEE